VRVLYATLPVSRRNSVSELIPIPEALPINPLSLECPTCKAEPGRNCVANTGPSQTVHFTRVEAAAAIDVGNKRKRDEFIKAVRELKS